MGRMKEIGIPFEAIATIDAERWVEETLAVVSERITTRGGVPHVSLDAGSWAAVQAAGNAIRGAQNAEVALPDAAVDTVKFAGAVRWEAATLMGWGFIDGEHPAAPVVDQIHLDEDVARGRRSSLRISHYSNALPAKRRRHTHFELNLLRTGKPRS